MRWILIVALTGLLLGVGAAVGAFYYAKDQFERGGPGDVDTVFLLERGTGLNRTAAKLEEQGLIANALIFRIALQIVDPESTLKAGEYLLPAKASMADIAKILREGKSILHKLTLAEGLTSWEAMQVIAADPVLVGEVPEVPEEGALLPETYLFTRGTSRADIIAQMEAAHIEVVERLWEERAENLPITSIEEAVILASIVEKETGVADERPRVAAVFTNRLRRGMRLQSDPTIIYGITNGQGPLGRPIRRSEIDRKTAYNTYQIDGLPPAPIANPGEASIAAVLNPPTTSDLYFVADGTGGHVFSKTLAEHNRNVAKWRRIERSRRQ
ncbi:MAG: endolytic transglycosylase MltG [Rhodobiaceae bacterium]|nr:endolytic transglycosylase MltG [Rhodobiaceae bacterium]